MKDELESIWDVDEPSPDFASRVVSAAQQHARKRPDRRYLIGGLALAAAAVTLVVVWPRSDRALAQGEATADQRVEVPIGERAVAVLEPGAHVRWHGDRVEQDRGDVFYRVERGATFIVSTPHAEASVLGTSFRISIEQETGMKRRDVTAGALGAVAGIMVVVGVYEGKVRVSRADQAVTLRAGERAVADETGVRTSTPATVARPTDSGNARTEAQLRQRLDEIEKEKATLEQELIVANDAVGKHPYDLTPDDWARMAEKGEFKYQLPCYEKGGFRPSPEQLEKLGLEPSAADAIQQAYLSSNKRFYNDMVPLCSEMLGKPADSGTFSDCFTQLFAGIYRGGDSEATFRQLAEIRAGKRPESDASTPTLKMLMVFSGGMAPFEAELAKTFGAENAHRIAYSDDLCFKKQSM
jgi:hypothetical protein